MVSMPSLRRTPSRDGSDTAEDEGGPSDITRSLHDVDEENPPTPSHDDSVLQNDIDLLNPPPELEKRKHKKKRLVQSPNSFMASAGGYMVAFAGRKYAARSQPVFVSNSVTVSSFTLVLEFNKGRLQNLHWKKDGCGASSGKANFICLGKQTCAIRTNICKSNNQGSMDCSVGIQLAFSGTDKHESVLNSWYHEM